MFNKIKAFIAAIPRDKKIHFGVCAVIAYIVSFLLGIIGDAVLYASISGFIAAMGTGVGKEVGDYYAPDNSWDWKDILADAIGAIIGCALASLQLIF